MLHTDVAIIGGGIAGLWTLNQLRNQGYSAILFEQEELGSHQTIASQGMIHGGIKYALGGALSGGSEAISTMPEIWRSCLRGEGKVDLRDCHVLSEDFYLWSSTGLQARLSSFFASKMLRGRVEKLTTQDYPIPFKDPAFRGQVYRLVDLVLDVASVVEKLTEHHRDAIFSIDWSNAALALDGPQAHIKLPGCTVVPQQLILCAGTGNEQLISQLGATEPAMQRRPLQQVLVKHDYHEKLYAHCMGGNSSPRLTISSHNMRNGDPVWYLGGDLATAGQHDDPDALIDKTRKELAELLPWVDLGRCEWRTIKIDRAEPRQSGLLRPDSAYLGKLNVGNNVLAAWPTKLTLSPDLADKVERQLAADDIHPRYRPDLTSLAKLGRPQVAPTCWDTLFT